MAPFVCVCVDMLIRLYTKMYMYKWTFMKTQHKCPANFAGLPKTKVDTLRPCNVLKGLGRLPKTLDGDPAFYMWKACGAQSFRDASATNSSYEYDFSQTQRGDVFGFQHICWLGVLGLLSRSRA